MEPSGSKTKKYGLEKMKQVANETWENIRKRTRNMH